MKTEKTTARVDEQTVTPLERATAMDKPAKSRTRTEYRLLIQRTGNAVKERRAASMKAIQRHIGLVTSPEPWRFYGDKCAASKGPDDYVCCAGTYHDQCSCGGMTMREETEARRRDLPPIESIRIHRRQITTTQWEPLESPQGVLAESIPGHGRED